MPTLSTQVQQLLVEMPNLLLAPASGLCLAFALVATAIPGGAAARDAAIAQRQRNFDYSMEEKQKERERLAKVAESEDNAKVEAAKIKADVAKTTAQATRDKAPHVAQQAKSERQKTVTDSKTKSTVKVEKRRTKAAISVVDATLQGKLAKVDARERQEVGRAGETAKYAIKQQETAHQTTRFSNLQKHLDVMTGLNQQQTTTAEGAALSAEENTKATKRVTQSVFKLTTAMNLAQQANLDLVKQIGHYDRAMVNGELSIEKEQALQAAFLQTLQAERKLETVLATAQVQDRSQIHQDLMKDLAVENKAIDAALGGCSLETVEKLSGLIQAEIIQEQEKIQNLSKPEDIETAQNHLKSLQQRLTQITHISAEKAPNLTATSTAGKRPS